MDKDEEKKKARRDASVDFMIRGVLCRGLEDTKIQMDLSGDKNQDMTLEQVLTFVEAKEADKRSASSLLLPQATDAVSGSSYKRPKKPPAKGSRNREACTYCGTREPSNKDQKNRMPGFWHQM